MFDKGMQKESSNTASYATQRKPSAKKNTENQLAVMQQTMGNQGVSKLIQQFQAQSSQSLAKQTKSMSGLIDQVAQKMDVSEEPIQREVIDSNLNTTNPTSREVNQLDQLDGQTFTYDFTIPEIGITHANLIAQLGLTPRLGGSKFVLDTPDSSIVYYGRHDIRIRGPQGKSWTIHIKLVEKEEAATEDQYEEGPIEGSKGKMTAEMHKLAFETYGVDDITLDKALSSLTSKSGDWNTIRTVNNGGILSELKLSRMKSANKRFFARTQNGGKVVFDEHGDHL